MATIRIKRTREYINIFRDYAIYIDGTKAGKISNGGTIDLPVQAGQHSIHAKIDWCYSPTLSFDIAEDQVTTFSVGGFKGAKWVMPVGLMLIALHYLLPLYFGADILFSILFTLPLFFILLYFVSTGRKKYLTITEELALTIA